MNRIALAVAAVGLSMLAAGCVWHPGICIEDSRRLDFPLTDSAQVVVVVCDDWDSTTAELRCFERRWGCFGPLPWRSVAGPIPVNIGRSGLAWGRGVNAVPRGVHALAGVEGPTKREGDGKAPAGVFELSAAFGYASQKDAYWVPLPYLHLTEDVFGVDDVKSKYYNQLVRLDQVQKDWDSAEIMRREDGLYEWGVLVDHNVPPEPGAGSCIFLHIWRGQGQPTAGCTAMSRDEMLKLLAWLDKGRRPVLVQLPRPVYEKLAAGWGLPPLH